MAIPNEAVVPEASALAEELALVPIGHWIALSSDGAQFVCSDARLDEAIAGALRRGVTEPLMTKSTPDLLLL